MTKNGKIRQNMVHKWFENGLEMTKYVLKMTKYVLKMTKYVLKMTKYVLKMTKYVVKITKYGPKWSKLGKCGQKLSKNWMNFWVQMVYERSKRDLIWTPFCREMICPKTEKFCRKLDKGPDLVRVTSCKQWHFMDALVNIFICSICQNFFSNMFSTIFTVFLVREFSPICAFMEQNANFEA